MKAGFGGYGFKDKLQKDGSWKVSAQTTNRDGYMFSQDVALYRSAEIAREAGKGWFQILDVSTRSVAGGTMLDQENTWLVIVPADSADPPATCHAKFATACKTLNVDETLARIGPTFAPPVNKPSKAE